jgi:hypothetical protein
LRNDDEPQTRETHLEGETPCEVRLIQVELAWRVWIRNKVSHAVTDVPRAPQSICRPPSDKQTGYDKGEAVYP